jgi:hypothetical protein
MWFGADEPVLDDRVRLDGDGRIMAGQEAVSILCRSSGNVERAFVPGKMNLETLEASSVRVQGCVARHKTMTWCQRLEASHVIRHSLCHSLEDVKT